MRRARSRRAVASNAVASGTGSAGELLVPVRATAVVAAVALAVDRMVLLTVSLVAAGLIAAAPVELVEAPPDVDAAARLEFALPAARAEEAAGLLALAGEEPVPDELCVDEPESPDPAVSAQAAPAPARIATPTPRPTARPPIRPTYAEAFVEEPITSPLAQSRRYRTWQTSWATLDTRRANKFPGQTIVRSQSALAITMHGTNCWRTLTRP